MPRKLEGSYIQSGSITTAQLDTAVSNQISGPKITSLVYPGDDTAANTVGGQTIYILGSNFAANASVYINGNVAPSISYISASNLQITTPSLSAATYPVYVINPETGATAIKIPGLLVSGDPSWVTAAGSLSSEQEASSAWSYTVSANSDSAVTYALAAGSSLPSGISLAANGLISGTISSPPASATTYNFTVEATDAENQSASREFSVTVTTGEGVLFANNVLLIHADATNNKNNHTFVDSSSNNFTITRNGNATQGTFSPFSQTGWSNYFDGTTDWLHNSSASANTVLGGSNDFTIEAWVYLPEYKNYGIFCGYWNASATQNWVLRQDATTGRLQFYSSTNGSDISVTSTGTIGLNKWVHIAATRSGSSFKLFINGTVDGTATSSATLTTTSNYFSIGGTGGANPDTSTGYISNLRIIKGNALYTANFTPPTAALTAVSNTSILTCQSNRFIDNSNNAFALTRNGDVSVEAFSPFAPTAAYTTANVGGSAYFDGTGDYLSVADNAALDGFSGDFTIEFWYYPKSLSGAILAKGWTNAANFAPYLFLISSGNILFYASSTNSSWDIISGTAVANSVKLNTWTHIAVSRSGSTVRLFADGVVTNTVTTSATFVDISDSLTVGSAGGGYSVMGAGYVSNVRIVKGTAVYTGAFTPPTAPLTNIANTSLLCNFTNAGIFDQTAKNVIETVGDAKISTAQYKYGNSSMYFDGTGDALKVISGGYPTLANFTKSGYAGTIEMWVYLSSMPGNRSHLVGFWTNSSGWTIDVNSSGDLFFSSDGAGDTVTLSSKITSGSWIHLAFVNTGSIINIYKDGTNVGTKSNYSPGTPTANLYVGIRSDSTLGLIGYIDDLRVTQGYARYTSNFTAPTAAFKDS